MLLPPDPFRFNLAPRLDGPHPIGEKDLDNQESYIAARPFTIGCLLDIASRVRSGRVEVTSLVRHGEYQDALRRTNANAMTDVPTHAMGLAIDIALINTPLATVYEIRDVLREMREAGDLLFIGERKQLVFHVVPHPSRLGYFTDIYTRAFGAPSATQAAYVVAPAPPPVETVVPAPRLPRVTTEVVAVLPADATLEPVWWAAMDAAGSATSSSSERVPDRSSGEVIFAAALIGGGWLALITATYFGRAPARSDRPMHVLVSGTLARTAALVDPEEHHGKYSEVRTPRL